MKYLWRIAFIGVLLSPMAKAEVTVVTKKKQSAKLKAFENLDAKLEALESYSVVYWENNRKRYVVMKSGPAPQGRKSSDQLSVELLPAGGKS